MDYVRGSLLFPSFESMIEVIKEITMIDENKLFQDKKKLNLYYSIQVVKIKNNFIDSKYD